MAGWRSTTSNVLPHDCESLVDRHLYRGASAPLILLRPRPVHQDASHQAGGHRQKVSPVLPFDLLDVDETEVRLVDEGRGLQTMAARSPAMHRFAIRCSSLSTSGTRRSKAASSPLPQASSNPVTLPGSAMRPHSIPAA